MVLNLVYSIYTFTLLRPILALIHYSKLCYILSASFANGMCHAHTSLIYSCDDISKKYKFAFDLSLLRVTLILMGGIVICDRGK